MIPIVRYAEALLAYPKYKEAIGFADDVEDDGDSLGLAAPAGYTLKASSGCISLMPLQRPGCRKPSDLAVFAAQDGWGHIDPGVFAAEAANAKQMKGILTPVFAMLYGDEISPGSACHWIFVLQWDEATAEWRSCNHGLLRWAKETLGEASRVVARDRK